VFGAAATSAPTSVFGSSVASNAPTFGSVGGASATTFGSVTQQGIFLVKILTFINLLNLLKIFHFY
jgi:hypothetical protein